MNHSYDNTSVAVLGYGVEGTSAARYFLERGAQVTVVDHRLRRSDIPADYDVLVDDDATYKLAGFDYISRSPSIRPDLIETDGEVTSVTQEFFAHCLAPIIAVTGTKGKGTTATLIAHILDTAGFKVHLLGNIGTPALDVLEDIKSDHMVVYEASSFQLWDMKKSPQTAVVLMIDTDHLDVHSTMQEYVDAKKNITKFQGEGDRVIYHPSNKYSDEISAAGMGKRYRFLHEEAAHIRGEDIIIEEHKICSTSDVGLIGAHNLENVAAAISAAWLYTEDVDAIATAVMTFKGLEHRLEFVDIKDDVVYFNDSFSSAVAATKAAVASFAQPIVLVVGGKDKGGDVNAMADAIVAHDVKHAVAIGEMSAAIEKALKVRGYHAVSRPKGGMAAIVADATSHAASGDVVLLSPGTSSYDMFKNFKDRGYQYKKVVNEL